MRRLNPVLEWGAGSLCWLVKGPLFDPFKEGTDASGEDRNAPGARDFTIDNGGEAVRAGDRAADRQGAVNGAGNARKAPGRRDELAGKVQERYGIAMDAARKQVDEWARNADDTWLS